jgi:hypothetical protein
MILQRTQNLLMKDWLSSSRTGKATFRCITFIKTKGFTLLQMLSADRQKYAGRYGIHPGRQGDASGLKTNGRIESISRLPTGQWRCDHQPAAGSEEVRSKFSNLGSGPPK